MVIPYVKDFSKSVARIMKKKKQKKKKKKKKQKNKKKTKKKKTWHINIYATTLQTEESLSSSERQNGKGKYFCVVYHTIIVIPCHNCELNYLGETGGKFNTRSMPRLYHRYTPGLRSEVQSDSKCFLDPCT